MPVSEHCCQMSALRAVWLRNWEQWDQLKGCLILNSRSMIQEMGTRMSLSAEQKDELWAILYHWMSFSNVALPSIQLSSLDHSVHSLWHCLPPLCCCLKCLSARPATFQTQPIIKSSRLCPLVYFLLSLILINLIKNDIFASMVLWDQTCSASLGQTKSQTDQI